MTSCPVCHSPQIQKEHQIKSILDIYRCRTCTHRHAVHHQSPHDSGDYHLQYDQNNFVDHLRITRVRQAHLIYEKMLQLLGAVDRVIDVGAGRGWFLQTLQTRGVHHLAGMDNSKWGLAALETMKIPGIETDASLRFSIDTLPFSPRVLCFLDVLEHFHEPIDVLLKPFVKNFRDSLELIVIKVPMADGLLYRMASGLARLGWSKPLAQLYQAGTFPPHFQYYSETSLQKILGQDSSRSIQVIRDSDFEPNSFRHRFWSASNAVRAVCGVLGGFLYYAGRVFGLYDSHIIFLDLRPGKTSRSEEFLERGSRDVRDVVGQGRESELKT